jgi:glycerophosphoryl diester phosphodiesterase
VRALVLTVLLTLLTVPAAPGAADPRPDRDVTVIGHRGASADAPENTLPAVALAIEQGADLVEIDVQLSLDRQIVLLHDTTLGRTTNVAQVLAPTDPRAGYPHVGVFTAAELAALDAGSWGRFEGGPYAGAHVPTLREALNLFRGHPEVGILIEVKEPRQSPGIEALLVSELDAFERAGLTNPHVVQSFDHQSMATYDALQRQVGLDHPIGLLGTIDPGLFSTYRSFADQINPSHGSLTAGYVEAAHAAGFTVNPYTVNDHCRMQVLIHEIGVDGIITDQPAELRRVLDPQDDLVDLGPC